MSVLYCTQTRNLHKPDIYTVQLNSNCLSWGGGKRGLALYVLYKKKYSLWQNSEQDAFNGSIQKFQVSPEIYLKVKRIKAQFFDVFDLYL